MRPFVAFAAALLWLTVAKTPPCAAHPEHVDEVWRSPYGVIRSDSPIWTPAPLSAAVDPQDGSVWLTAGANLVHLAEDGTLVFRSEALYAPFRVAVDPADGSCWVLEGLSFRVLHFAADGRLLSATPFRLEGGAEHPMYNWLTPSPADGSVWVTGWDHLARIDATGAEVWRSEYVSRYASRYAGDGVFQAVVDPTDGSAWTLDGKDVVRVLPDGSEVWRVSGLDMDRVLDEDPRNQSVWTVLSRRVAHVSWEGAVVWQAESERAVSDIHVSPIDGSVWVSYFDRPLPTVAAADGDASGADVVHLDSSGAELWRFPNSKVFAYSDCDGSVWIQTWDPQQAAVLVHFSAAHDELHRLPYTDCFTHHFVAHNPSDNSFWVEDRESRRLLHIGPDGTALWEDRTAQLHQLWGARGWVDPEDGSVWVLDRASLSGDPDECVHLSAEGTELGRRPWPDEWPTPRTMIISPFDGSWWVVCGEDVNGTWTATLLHLAQDGTQLWRRDGGLSNAIAVDEDDGSLWLVENSYVGWNDAPLGRVYRLTADGTQVWVSEFPYWLGPVAVDPNDGSAWVSAGDPAGMKLMRFSPAAAIVAQIPLADSLTWTSDLTVLESDGSIYVAGQLEDPATLQREGRVLRIGSDGVVVWQGDGFVDPVSLAVDARDGSTWVADAGEQDNEFSPWSAVVHLGADGTELWRGEAFNLPQAVEVNARDGSVWVSDWQNGQVVHLRGVLSPFSDVPGDFWSFHEILACTEAGIVFGYGEDRYQPSLAVTRDQMAAYVARSLAGGDAHVSAGPATASFPDVPLTHWAYRYVEYCYDRGVVEGYGDGYHPDEAVNRAQMAVYVARALAGGESNLSEDPYGTPFFPDVGADHWAYRHVEYCHDRGIVQGYWDGYRPDEVVSRAQMAVYVQRAFNLPV